MKKIKRQLLIVEENPHIVTVLTQTLRDEYTITVATNSRDAVRFLIQGLQFDCIITELNLPFFDGLELIKLLRMNKLSRNTFAIVLSDAADSDTRIACLEAGADAHIAKPFNPVEISVTLRTLANRYGLAETQDETPVIPMHSSLLKRFWSPNSLNL
ncbi:response regulator [Fibrivirga algicola]|uniref:Response regulator n=1 Tax=Fibrivirga algicola TaxID=2950420 RepID=A0ABX0QHM2_9BACT|nr:response regulator [Fibrivirga algicola]ARK10170.1 response regulator receiver protein [Fibrella sp. ES10-3-2-2]NID11378.1 response regulator [Fibrivirga algicola]